MLAGGTGNDLARNVGAPANDIDATLDLAFDGPDKRIDVGFANETAFVNCFGVGFDVAVIQSLPRGGSSLGAHAYMLTAARRLWRFKPITIGTERCLVLVIGNGARFGGGIVMAPDAAIDDGLLDLIQVRDLGPLARMRTLLAASRGKHLGMPGVTHQRAPSFELTFDSPPLFEVDGELVQSENPTLQVRCDRQRLRICAP